MSVITVLDASGGIHSVNTSVVGAGETPHSIPEIGGSAIGSGNPLPVSLPSITPVASMALEAGHVLKASACSLYAFQVTYSVSGWVMVLDSSTIPVDGAVTPIKWWQVSESLGNTLDKTFSPPLAIANGATLVFSTTGPFTKTGSATAVFSGEAQ